MDSEHKLELEYVDLFFRASQKNASSSWRSGWRALLRLRRGTFLKEGKR
jgi:hypothetical protein